MENTASNNRLVVDPITRIEGHLRIEAEMDGNTIKQAFSSGTSVRGIELILQGRDPRDAWAFAQRICGVCTLVHGMASVRAVEDASLAVKRKIRGCHWKALHDIYAKRTDATW